MHPAADLLDKNAVFQLSASLHDAYDGRLYEQSPVFIHQFVGLYRLLQQIQKVSK